MKEYVLSKKLKAEAIGNGLCKQWTDEWEDNSNKLVLAEKFKRGLDFCIKHDWPSREELDDIVDAEFNSYGIYNDQNVSIVNNQSMSGETTPLDEVCEFVLNGECNANIVVHGTTTIVWVRHDSEATVLVSGDGTAYVKCLDNASVKIRCGLKGKAYCYRYSENARIDAKGDVHMREKVDFYKK
jgi:hypothetical protein